MEMMRNLPNIDRRAYTSVVEIFCIFVLVASAVLIAIPTVRGGTEANPDVYDLIADGPDSNFGLIVGNVTVWNTTDTLYIKFTTNTTAPDATQSGWYLNETHLALDWDNEGDGPDGIPQTGNSNPKVGKFTLPNGTKSAFDHPDGTYEFTYDIPLADIGNPVPGTKILIAAQAVVSQWVDGDNPDTTSIVEDGWRRYESAWGDGTDFNTSRNWAMYFEYIVQV
jgi:hypothetical protein